MHRFIFPLVALSTLLVLHVVVQLAAPGAVVTWSVPWLMVWVAWAVVVVPVMFMAWSKFDEAREARLVNEALVAYRLQTTDAMPKVAKALLAVVEHEDITRLQQLLTTLVPQLKAEAEATEFTRDANAWLTLARAEPTSVVLIERYHALENSAMRLSKCMNQSPRA